MHSNLYTYRFVVIMTTLTALVIGGLYTIFKDVHLYNEAIFNKRAVLSAVADQLDGKVANMSDKEVLAVFENIEQVVLDAEGEVVPTEKVKELRNFKNKEGLAEDLDLAKEAKRNTNDKLHPLYIYKKGGSNFYITAVRGKGLWDEIWGFIAISDDFNTIAGASFDHKAETPGLGAEIKDNPTFAEQFEGEKFYNEKGDFVSVNVVKGGANPKNVHAVDGITGATVTSDGVEDMIEEGIKNYLPYFEKLKKG